MLLETIIVGELETNCYFLVNDGRTVIVDPGGEANNIIEFLDNKKLTPVAIINTHGHYDHIFANNALQQKFKIPVYFPAEDKYLLPYQEKLFGSPKFKIDHVYRDKIEIENFPLKVIATPGHSKGSSSLLVDNLLLSGDMLFADGYLGRTDLWGGSAEDIKNSLAKLLELSDEVIVYPGHGPSTTIGLERANHV